MQQPKSKPVHMAFTAQGKDKFVAICFDQSTPIDPERGSWTLDPDKVTCRRCRKKMGDTLT